MITQADINAVRERCERATPGPWKTGLYRSVNAGNLHAYSDADADFIAHAREDVPALLDMINDLHDRTGTYISMGSHLKLIAEYERLKARCEAIEKVIAENEPCWLCARKAGCHGCSELGGCPFGSWSFDEARFS